MIVYNGVNLETAYSCNISRVDTDESPARETESVAIAGRSGDLIIDSGRYPNVDMEYVAMFQGENADANAVNLKNFLLLQVGYKELRDAEHSDEFYLAAVSKNIKPEITRERSLVKMRLVFNRKPQRYLLSGNAEYSLLSGHVEGNPLYVDPADIDESTMTVSVAMDYVTGERNHSNTGFNYLENVRIMTSSGQSIDITCPYLMAIDAVFESSGAVTVTKWVDDHFPMVGWQVTAQPSISLPYIRFGAKFPTASDYSILDCSFAKYVDYQTYVTTVPVIFSYLDETEIECLGIAMPVSELDKYVTEEQKDTLSYLEKFYIWLNHAATHELVFEGTKSAQLESWPTLQSGSSIAAEVYESNPNKVSATSVIISADVTSSNVLNNPTLFASKPLIRLYGTGAIAINGKTVTVDDCTEYVDIDCDMMDCYEGTTNRNNDVTFSTYDFPELEVGENTFIVAAGSQIGGIRVTPRWWRL